MTKYEEIYFISTLIEKADNDKSVEFNDLKNWNDFFLRENTNFHQDYLFELNAKGILEYDEIGEDGFAPIIMCSINNNTKEYLKKLIEEVDNEDSKKDSEIIELNKRITDILTFDPNKLSNEIKTTGIIIARTKQQLDENPVLQPLKLQLEQIELHFKSLRKVANSYEEVYKNIILPVKEEGKSGVKQTVKWAIISIVISTILSVIISWLTK